LRTDVHHLTMGVDFDREAYELAREQEPPRKTTVDVIVVTHDSRDALERCFHAIQLAAAEVDADVLVVDTASADDSLDFVDGHGGPRVRTIGLADNSGYAAAVDAAAELSSADYLIVLNPD